MTMHYDPSAFTPQAAASGFDPAPNSNFLADCEATILERYASARSASRQSLEDLRVVGERLNDAKDALKDKRGAFTAWFDACRFPFTKQWRARLMKLATHWD